MPSSQERSAVWKEQKVVADDGTASAWFGLSVAISGNIAFVGARNATVNGHSSQGAVYVFEKKGNLWLQIQKLVASDGIEGDQFGGSIALLGTIAIISAPLATIDGKPWQGATYVFSRSGNAWVQKQKLVASDGTAFGSFGTAVALNANYAFIGAGGVNQSGHYLLRAVYVFVLQASHTGGVWIEKQKLAAPDSSDATSGFGASMAVSGTTALIGAYSASLGGVPGRGAVYAYTELGGLWSLTNTLTASDGAARNNFGTSIAISGGSALIGSPGVLKGTLSVGAVYRFDHKNGDWVLAQEFHAMDAGAVNFGASVSMAGATALIGAYAADTYRGTAYVFEEQAGVWTQAKQLKASDGAPGDVFGYTTALDASTALVGSFSAKVGGNEDQGAVYFYTIPHLGGGLSAT